jgi:two-component system, response regulator
MIENIQTVTFLMAEDDSDDRLLIKEAFRENRVVETLNFVVDGVELLDYLRRQGKYANPGSAPTPDLILLDLNMPRKDGREALEEIKTDPHLRHIPVVVLTTSNAEEDIIRSYDVGAAGFITKPMKFGGLVDAIKGLKQYWEQVVRLPAKDT